MIYRRKMMTVAWRIALAGPVLMSHAQADLLKGDSGPPGMSIIYAVEGTPCPGTGSKAYSQVSRPMECINGTWKEMVAGFYTQYSLAQKPNTTNDDRLSLGRHKYCALSGQQSEQLSDTHCSLIVNASSIWELSARVTTSNPSEHWCIATCLD